MKKRILSLVTIIVLLLSSMSVYAQAGDTPSRWAMDELSEARVRNLIIPEAEGNYQDAITRELFCKLVVNFIEVRTGETIAITIDNPFIDSDDADIIKAYQLGIVNGGSDNKFAPSNLVTRQEISIMMVRAAKKIDEMLPGNKMLGDTINIEGVYRFSDEGDYASWADTAIKEAFMLGLMKGASRDKFAPLDNTTVEASIVIIRRAHAIFLSRLEVDAMDDEESFYDAINDVISAGDTTYVDSGTAPATLRDSLVDQDKITNYYFEFFTDNSEIPESKFWYKDGDYKSITSDATTYDKPSINESASYMPSLRALSIDSGSLDFDIPNPFNVLEGLSDDEEFVESYIYGMKYVTTEEFDGRTVYVYESTSAVYAASVRVWAEKGLIVQFKYRAADFTQTLSFYNMTVGTVTDADIEYPADVLNIMKDGVMQGEFRFD